MLKPKFLSITVLIGAVQLIRRTIPTGPHNSGPRVLRINPFHIASITENAATAESIWTTATAGQKVGIARAGLLTIYLHRPVQIW